MASDHGLGLDLVAIQKGLGSHSVFAPSASAMWLYCSGSLIPNLLAPDDAGEDAAYGTVGHGVAEKWLNAIKRVWEDMASPWPTQDYPDFADNEELVDYCAPTELIGTVEKVEERKETFLITIDEEMLSYVREYVVWCMELPGAHYIETRVDFSQITPIPKQGGTADHAACVPRVLTITDLKLGKGVQVYAEKNTQALIYALGFFFAYDHLYHFERIVIRIAQPRRDHWDVWETDRETLLRFAEWAKERAYAAWVPNAPRTPGEKQCQWCRVSADCAAHLAWMVDATEGVFEAVGEECQVCEGLGCDACESREITVREDGTIEGVAYTVKGMEAAEKSFLAGKSPLIDQPPGKLSTEALERLLPHRKRIEKWFAEIEAELEFRARQGEELKHHKLVPGRLGNREYVDEEVAAEELEWLGLEADEIHTRKLKSPAQIAEILHKRAGLKKKDADNLISRLVTRKPSRDTLAPITDRREAIEDMGDVFEAVADDADL